MYPIYVDKKDATQVTISCRLVTLFYDSISAQQARLLSTTTNKSSQSTQQQEVTAGTTVAPAASTKSSLDVTLSSADLQEYVMELEVKILK